MCGDEGVETRGEGLHVFVSGRRRHRAAGIAIPTVHVRLVPTLVMEFDARSKQRRNRTARRASADPGVELRQEVEKRETHLFGNAVFMSLLMP